MPPRNFCHPVCRWDQSNGWWAISLVESFEKLSICVFVFATVHGFVHGIRAMGGGQSQGLLFGRGGSLPYPRDIVVPHNESLLMTLVCLLSDVFCVYLYT